MLTHLFFALTASEMGLSPTILALIVVSSIVFIVGFAKSSRENEYKKLMDSFIERKDPSLLIQSLLEGKHLCQNSSLPSSLSYYLYG